MRKVILIGLISLITNGCATTVRDASTVCGDGALESFSNDDFNMKCQEHKIVEYRGLPKVERREPTMYAQPQFMQAPQPQIMYMQPPKPQIQPQVIYLQQPQVKYVTQPSPEPIITKGNGNGAGFGGRQIISRVKK